MKKLLLILFALFVLPTCARADVLDDCLERVYSTPDVWQNRLFGPATTPGALTDPFTGMPMVSDLYKKNYNYSQLNQYIFPGITSCEEITPELIKKNASKIKHLLGMAVELVCPDKIVEIARLGGGKAIKFNCPDKQGYTETFYLSKISDLIDYTNDIRSGILVLNRSDLAPGDVLSRSDIPKGNGPYFSDDCSDHSIWDNLDDDTAVNQAGQKTFVAYSKDKNEFFLDFAKGNNMRAFPGLVLMDKTWSTEERIVAYMNPAEGADVLQTFLKNLRAEGKCSNQGLYAYLVGLDVKKMETDTNSTEWAIGLWSTAGVGAGVAVWAAASTAAWTSATLFTVAGVSANVPIIGWVVAGLTAVTGTIVALVPREIEPTEYVMVFDGPYPI